MFVVPYEFLLDVVQEGDVVLSVAAVAADIVKKLQEELQEQELHHQKLLLPETEKIVKNLLQVYYSHLSVRHFVSVEANLLRCYPERVHIFVLQQIHPQQIAAHHPLTEENQMI